MQGNNSIVKAIAILLLLLFLSSYTRFENALQISYKDGQLSTVVDGITTNDVVPNLNVDGIATVHGKSMTSEVVLDSLQVNTKEYHYQKKYRLLYIFGVPVWGDAIKGEFPSFRNTFGDWSIDRFVSVPIDVPVAALGDAFSITARFVGRGDKRIILKSSPDIVVSLRDGFIDNDYSVCTNQKCYFAGSSRENLSNNIKRILNFFIEAVLFGFLIVTTVRVIDYILNRITLSPLNIKIPVWFDLALVIVLALAHLGLAVWFNQEVLGGIPHIPDSSVYYRQAIMLSHGMLGTPLPQVGLLNEDSLKPFISNGGLNLNGLLVYHYCHFWPAILAVFIFLKLAWLCNPLLSTLSLLIAYQLVRKYLGRWEAVVTAVFYALSPFTIIMAGDYMTHVATLFLILSGIFVFQLGVSRRSAIMLVMAGFLIAYALAIRQITVVAVLLVVAPYFLWRLKKRIFDIRCLYIFLGAVPPLALLLLDNKYLTGDCFVSPYQKYHSITFGLQNILYGANWTDSTLGFLSPVLFAAPCAMLLAGLATVWIFIQRRLVYFAIFLPFISLVIFHMLVNVHGIHGYGPRFLYEGSISFYTLASVGVVLLFKEVFSPITKILLLIIFSSAVVYNAKTLCEHLPDYVNYNGLENSLYNSLLQHDLKNSIFIITNTSWQGMDVAATLFDPYFKDLIVLQESDKDLLDTILSKYPQKTAYIVNGRSAVPYLR